MGFSTNFSEAQEYGLIPEGEYECLIKSIEEKTSYAGNMGLNFHLIIRNDIEQKFKNRIIFLTLWKRKEPTNKDKAVDGYSFSQVMTLADSAGLQDGKEYADMGEFLRELEKKCIRVTIEHETFNDKTRENVKYINKTKYTQCNHTWAVSSAPKEDTYAPPKQEAFANAPAVPMPEGFEEINDGDVPF